MYIYICSIDCKARMCLQFSGFQENYSVWVYGCNLIGWLGQPVPTVVVKYRSIVCGNGLSVFLLSYSLTVFPPIHVAVEIRGMSMTTD